MVTMAEVERERERKWAELCPAEVTAEAAARLVRDLGVATMAELAGWSAEAPELVEQEVQAGRVVELALWPGELRYVARELLGYVYVLVGDRKPKEDYRRQAEKGQLSWLAAEVYERLLAAPAGLTGSALRTAMGAEGTSILGIERAFAELARTLKIVRTGRRGGENLWRPLADAFPEAPPLLDTVSANEAAAALVSLRLSRQVCETEEGLAAYFSPVLSRARVHAAVRGLEAARELAPESLEGRPALVRRHWPAIL